MRRTTSGFTIIELLVVISIIGILTTVGIVSFARVQSFARDSQRSAKVTVISEALEKYYSQNGEYPTCATLMQSINIVVTTTLKDMDRNALTTPSAASGTNSIICTDPSTDVFGYIGGGAQYTLKYHSEETGAVVAVSSRHAPAK